MEPILTIDNLNSFGGNMLRQGDKSQLKYRLRDVGNKNLNISGKSCQVKMYGRNYTTVVYKTTTTVSSDNTVSFTIDNVLPKGTFYLEFTVGDYIFPTDHREFFEITPSGKGMEANIIEIVGVDAVVRKAVDLINEDPNLIIDEDKLVNDIISNTGIGNINEYYKAFNDLKPKAEQSITKSAEALTKSQNALNVANGIDAKATNALSLSESADTLSKSVQEQFNQVVIDGDSSVEAAQARVDTSGETNPTLKARLDKEYTEVTTQLVQTQTKVLRSTNAEIPLNIKTYDGFNQPTHPSVIYFDNRWNGYKYWMAYTPFPFNNDFYENPSIAVSHDGVSWEDFPGLENPLDSVTQEENDNRIYLSDTELVYNGTELELWYRWYNNQTQEEKLYRRTTVDGLNWTQKQMVYNRESGSQRFLSPTIIYDGGTYKMWFVTNSPFRVCYTESTNLTDWSPLIDIPINDGLLPWHISIFRENNGLYHIIINNFVSGTNGENIYWGTSSDGKSFENVQLILETPKKQNTWDNMYLYRASLIKVEGAYKLYYAAAGHRLNRETPRWGIGLVEGQSLTSLTPSKYYNENGEQEVVNLRGRNARFDLVTAQRTNIVTSDNEKPYLKFLHSGVSGAGIKTSDRSNALQVVNDKGNAVGGLEVGFFFVNRLRALINSINIDDTVHFNNSVYVNRTKKETENPEIRLKKTGSHAVALVSEENRVLRIKDENSDIGGHLKATTVILGNTVREVEGSIRYNTRTKKHQGYDGTTWHNLY